MTELFSASLWYILKCLLRRTQLAIHQRLRQLERSDVTDTVANVIGDAIIPGILTSAVAVAPFLLFQWYAFTEYCGLTKPKLDYDANVIRYAEENSLKLPSAEPAEWCRDKIPIPYSYVQSRYWDVGFLRYFELRQAPNFLLAAPAIALILWSGHAFFRRHRHYCLRLGCTYFNLDPGAPRAPAHDVYRSGVLPKDCFVYVAHAVFLALFCLLFAHVQIATRMICSSSPVLYWVAAVMTASPERKATPNLDLDKEAAALKLESQENLEHWWKSALTEEPVRRREGRWLRDYFVGYAVVGTVMFSNFLPWT